MSKRIRRTIAGLTLALAAATGAVITHTAAAHVDTTATADSTVTTTDNLPSVGSAPADSKTGVDLTITPLDTTWG